MNSEDRVKRSRRTGRRMGCLTGVISALAILLGIIFLLRFQDVEKTDDLAKYETLLSDPRDLKTRFAVFPLHIPESGLENDPDFFYFFDLGSFKSSAEIYLRCTYGEEDFNAEVSRLENALLEPEPDWELVSDEPHIFRRDEEGRFSYPAYIAVLADDYSYEYALITGEREITYVFYAFISPGRSRAIPRDCLPDPCNECLDRDEDGYNIYYFHIRDESLKRLYELADREKILALRGGGKLPAETGETPRETSRPDRDTFF